MIVQRVVVPVTGAESWTMLGPDGAPVEPVESFLAYLSALERSPNTQRAYATSLRLWFEFLETVGVNWADVSVDDVGRFVSWLRAPAPNVIVLAGGTARRSPATVNRHLAAIFGFYEHHARSGVKVAAGLVSWRRIGRGSYKPFLHHVTGGRPIATRPVKLPIPQRAPRTLSPEQLVQVLAAPVRARDRFLLALLQQQTAGSPPPVGPSPPSTSSIAPAQPSPSLASLPPPASHAAGSTSNPTSSPPSSDSASAP